MIFLAHSYRFVYCLDMSPSQCIVDIQKGEILFDEILNSFKASVDGLTKQVNNKHFKKKLFLVFLFSLRFLEIPLFFNQVSI